MMRRNVRLLLLTTALLATATAARGQTPCPPDRTWTLEPSASDTYGIQFVGRTLASGTIAVLIRKAKIADAAPDDIITQGPTASGDLISFRIHPDEGCTAPLSGCRAGNVYQLRVTVTDSYGNTPTANVCVRVQWEHLTP